MSGLSKPLLIIKVAVAVNDRQRELISREAERIAARVGCECLVLERDLDAQVATDIAPLVEAVSGMAKSVQALADSNQALIQALAEVDEEDGLPPATYLDGSPCR